MMQAAAASTSLFATRPPAPAGFTRRFEPRFGFHGRIALVDQFDAQQKAAR